ncbi:hypothetical protein [Amycolatopsis sp. GM8]|nr:hypothetical protein [Amycolatopsis sp. GM8]
MRERKPGVIRVAIALEIRGTATRIVVNSALVLAMWLSVYLR